MPNLGAPELIVIVLVALVVFGPRKLPELGKSLGAGLREFRRVTGSVTDEFKATIDAPTPTVVSAPTVAAPVPAAMAAAPVTDAPRPS